MQATAPTAPEAHPFCLGSIRSRQGLGISAGGIMGGSSPIAGSRFLELRLRFIWAVSTTRRLIVNVIVDLAPRFADMDGLMYSIH
jgi:hypothetical protein